MPSSITIAAVVLAVVSFVGTAAFFTWMAVSVVRLRRSSHHRNNIQQQMVLMLELVCQELEIDLGHVPERAKSLTDSGEKL